jgi:hypothetical protein
VLTQEGTLIHEERTPEYERTLSPVVGLHPGWLDLHKTTGCMLELIEKDRGPSLCRGRVGGPACGPHSLIRPCHWQFVKTSLQVIIMAKTKSWAALLGVE